MKKKKIILGGLLGISVLAAGITLASCSVIPLTPYEPSTSVTPTPSSSASTPEASSSSNVTPAESSSEAPAASSSETPATTFAISYVSTHGTAPETKSNVTEITAEDLPALTDDNNAFVGWYTDAEFANEAVVGELTSNVTLYAKWVSFLTYSHLKELESSGDIRVSTVDPADYELAAGDNGLKENKIPEWETKPQEADSVSNRNYYDVLYQTRFANATATTVASKANNYIYAENGKIKMYDSGNADKGASIVIFDSRATTGIHEAVFDVSISAVASNFTFLQVMGKDTARAEAVNEIFGLRTVKNTDDNKVYFKYRVDGGDPVDPVTLVEQTASDVYHVYLKADVDNHLITVVINGEVIADGVEIPGLEALDYIRFVSSNSNATVVELSNIAFYQSMTKEQAVVFATDRLEKVIGAMDSTKYDADGLALINSLKATAITAFSAETVVDDADVFEILFNAIPSITSVETAAEKALASAKAQAETEISEYLDAASLEMFSAVGFEYEDENGDKVTLSLADLDQMLEADLDACTTAEQITDATNGLIVVYKAKIDSISDSSAAMLAFYKSKAKDGIDELYPSLNYQTNATEYQAAYDAFTTALNAATTKDAVDEAITSANTALAAVAKDSANLIAVNQLKEYAGDCAKTLLIYDANQFTGSEYETTLNTAVNGQIAIINAIDENDQDAIDSAFEDAKDAVDEAITGIREVTEFEITFVSSDVTIAKQTVVINSKVSIPTLTEEQSTSEKVNGLTKTYEVIGYYTTYENDTYSNEYSFDTVVSATTAHTIYAKTRVIKYVFEPSSADDMDNNGVFTFTDVADNNNSGKYTGGIRFDKTGDVLKFSVEGSGSIKVTPYVTQYSVKVNGGSAIANGVAYELFRDDTTEYSIERGESHTVIMTKVVVEMDYGTPVTLTQKVSSSASDDIKTTVLSGGTIELQNPTKTGYVFDGWYETYENDEYKDEITESSLTLNDSKTIYAKFTPITYNVEFELEGGQYDNDSTNPTQNSIAYGGTISELDETKIEKTDYFFLGWYTKDSNNEYSDDSFDFSTTLVEVPTTGSAVNIKLYAKWLAEADAQKATVTFDLNSGEYSGDAADLTQQYIVKYGKVKQLDTEKLSKTGDYAFDGWYTKNGADSDWGVEYNFGDYETSATGFTLYAKWCDTVDRVGSIVRQGDFSSFTEVANIESAKDYGVFTISPNAISQFVEQYSSGNSYISLYIGNSITFEVENDGAVFMLSYFSNNSKRKVVLNSTNTGYTETIKLTSGFTSGGTNYTFNGETIALEPSTKGWLIFDNLLAGTYTVTFDTNEESGTGEQKLERIKLIDTTTYKDPINSLTADVSTGINEITVSNVKLVTSKGTSSIDSGYKVYVDNEEKTPVAGVISGVSFGDHIVTIKYGDYTVYSKNVTVEQPYVTVNYGDNLTKTTTGYGETIVYPTSDELLMSGYNFIRYYYDEEFNEVADITSLATVPAKPVTLYARYMELGVNGVTYVSNADELVACINNSGSTQYTIYLTSDIDMSGSTYAGISSSFNSSVYGYGYKIMNWTATYAANQTAFFGKVYQCTIKDLIFENCNISDGGAKIQYFGMLGSQIFSSANISNITFKSCSINSTKKDSNTYGLLGEGSVVGDNIETLVLKNITIDDCEIVGNKYVGGILGRTNGANVSIINPKVDLTITNTTDAVCSVMGGVIGRIQHDASIEGGSVKVNFNFALKDSSDASLDHQKNGGVIGAIEAAKTVLVNGTKVEVLGNVNKTFGGIVGDAETEGTVITIRNCSVKFTNVAAAGQRVGGAVGYMNKVTTNIYDSQFDIVLNTSSRVSGVIGDAPTAGATIVLSNLRLTGEITVNSNSNVNSFVGGLESTIAVDFSTCTYYDFTLKNGTTPITSLQGTMVNE